MTATGNETSDVFTRSPYQDGAKMGQSSTSGNLKSEWSHESQNIVKGTQSVYSSEVEMEHTQQRQHLDGAASKSDESMEVDQTYSHHGSVNG